MPTNKDVYLASTAWEAQPPPTHSTAPALWPIVEAEMRARNEFGTQKYNTPLKPFNGRDALKDAYEEALDLCVYLRQALYERDGK